MDFDEMMEVWKAQDEQPLYGVNRDLLRLVVQNQQADLHRALRLERWTTYISAMVMTLGAGLVLWWFLVHRRPGVDMVLAAVSAVAFGFWAAAVWLSHSRQRRRERGFGNTLQEEVRRTLSAVDYQLSMVGRWTALTLWSMPVVVGASILYWLIAEMNDNTSLIFDASMIAFIVLSTLWANLETSRRRRRELLPRKHRLSELLTILDRP
jgi:hypothetical protein